MACRSEAFEVVSTLGKGTYGACYKVRRRCDGRIFVVKVVSLDGLSDRDRGETLNEARLMENLRHPNVVEYTESWCEAECLYIVMEYCTGGDLGRVLRERGGRVGEEEIWGYLADVAEGLRYLHSRRILHRIGFGSVRLGRNAARTVGAPGASARPGSPPERLARSMRKGKGRAGFRRDPLWPSARVGDRPPPVGWRRAQRASAPRGGSPDAPPSTAAAAPFSAFAGDRAVVGDLGLGRRLGPDSALARSQVGTPLYFSPELCQEQPYDHKSDVWAFGCLLYELTAGVPPFSASNQIALARKIVSGPTPRLIPGYSSHLQSLIEAMLDKSPVRRPSLTQILVHPSVAARVDAIRSQREAKRAKAKVAEMEKKLWDDLEKCKADAQAEIAAWREEISAEYVAKVADLKKTMVPIEELQAAELRLTELQGVVTEGFR
ncbi:unnamed protein product [Ostreobium quekettii]|uniref:non-specific serine/threonine protein kinase n=1 Tax=Ostreobium quekettii TaxID=121088 RepID=A0A8S1ITH8_9CHLO|nr:unnamed protein product [Ostreobium quekettii]